MITEHFMGNRTQWVTARCGRKYGGAFCWVQIVHAKFCHNNKCSKEPGTGTAYDRYCTGANVLGLHEKY
jgi:hypothetical protein